MTEVRSLAESCNRTEIQVQDITQALVNVGMLKPVDSLDVYEQYDTENRAAQNFLLWVVGHVPENARNVSKVNPEMLAANKLKSGGVSSAIPEYSQSQTQLQSMLKTQQQDVDEDWTQFLMARGNGKRPSAETFRNTVLNPQFVPKSDFYVTGPTPDGLVDRLPYNVRKQRDEYSEHGEHIEHGEHSEMDI